MMKHFLSITVIIFTGCEKIEYDFSQIKNAPILFYEALELEMYPGNSIGDDIFYLKSKHHENIYFVCTMVYGPGIEGGEVCLWAKTSGTEPYGLWYSMNYFSKYFPKHSNLKSTVCCAKTIKEYTKLRYGDDE